jgi:hypothetical protein
MMPPEDIKDWVSCSLKENKILFSELDVLLRALDRYFNISNLTFSENIAGKNFYEELLTVKDAVTRVLGILEVVIPDSKKNAYWFQKYTEAKFLPATKIDAFREELYRQDSPEKGLYLLYDSFINLRGLITDLLRSGNISYLGFSNVGNVLTKEIRENIFFNPFRKDLDQEFDVISASHISGIVKSLKDRIEKKQISLIYIYLFRLLRILGFVENSAKQSVSLHASLVILILLRSELEVFRNYTDHALRIIQSSKLRELLQSLSYQFAMESKRVYLHELKDINRKKKSAHFRGKIETCHGILKNMVEHSILQITNFYDPCIKGEDVFPSFMTKKDQSLRLREDITALHKFIALLKKADTPDKRMKVFESLKSYMLYFESFTARLLRYDDYEEFALFFNELNSIKKEMLLGPGLDKITEKVMHFKIFLETTLRQIGNRAELAGIDVDRERVEHLISQYL